MAMVVCCFHSLSVHHTITKTCSKPKSHSWGRVGPGARGGFWAQIWCTRGERIHHERIHVVRVTTHYKFTNLQTYKLTNLQTYKLSCMPTNLQTYKLLFIYITNFQTYKLTNFSLNTFTNFYFTNLQTYKLCRNIILRHSVHGDLENRTKTLKGA